MINRNYIEHLIAEHLLGTDKFLVELKLSPANKIDVFIDGLNGISIRDCVQMSRHIESSLNREETDFELNVSSPGAEQPFKVKQQYQKNIGKTVKIVTNNGEIVQGILKNTSENSLQIEKTEKHKKEIGKGKILVTENINLELDKVKEASVILSFK